MTLTSSVEPIRFISARSVLPAPCRLLSPAMYTSHVHAPLLLIGVSLLGRSSFRGRSRSAHSRGPALPARRCPGDRLPDDAAGTGETGRLPGVEVAQPRLDEPGERQEARVAAAGPRLPEHLGQAVGERAVRGRAVAILVGQLRLAARLEDDGQIRSAVPQVAALTVVAPVRQTAQRDAAAEAVGGAAGPEVGVAGARARERAVGGDERALLPHAELRVPDEGTVPDVVGGIEPAHAQAAVAGHAARVAAVEHGHEAAVVRKLAVELDELLVADGVRGVPVEVVRHQTLVQMIDLATEVIGRDLGAVARVEEQALGPILDVVQEPVQ